MNLSELTDHELLQRTKELVRRERGLLTEILHHLREIERRRLYSDLKYPSLLDYAVKELGYSEDQAARRISAMRLIKELPHVEGQISNGELSLAKVLLAQTLFAKEKKAGRTMNPSQKTDLLHLISQKSVREARKIVAAINPEMKRPSINFDMIEDENLRAKLLQLQGLYAHSHPRISLTELLHKICDAAIEAKISGRKLRPIVSEALRGYG